MMGKCIHCGKLKEVEQVDAIADIEIMACVRCQRKALINHVFGCGGIDNCPHFERNEYKQAIQKRMMNIDIEHITKRFG